MPKALHDKLKRQARKQGLTGDRAKAYVYGTMERIEQRRHVHVESATGPKRKEKR
mgnify:CR=1 FL=1